jgi:hypothetical protein
MVINYQALNKITIKDSFPLPHPDDHIARLQGGQCFSKLDFHCGYHQHCVHQNSIEKTAFVRLTGLYESLVMPFGLANAPREFMRLMTDLLKKHINNGYFIVFMDDIMIYSKDPETHKKHGQVVLNSVRWEGFRLQRQKCQFRNAEAPFLRFMVNRAGVSMTTEKITAIADWPDPVTPKEMRSFVRLAGVHRSFVLHFSKIAAPLTALQNVTPTEFNRVQNDLEKWKQVTSAIDILKAAIPAHPALALPLKKGGRYLVRTDASDFAIGATVRQMQKLRDSKWTNRIIAYFFR